MNSFFKDSFSKKKMELLLQHFLCLTNIIKKGTNLNDMSQKV